MTTQTLGLAPAQVPTRSRSRFTGLALAVVLLAVAALFVAAAGLSAGDPVKEPAPETSYAYGA